MKIKAITLLLIAALTATLFAGCGSKEAAEPKDSDQDVVTTASLITEDAALINALSKDGTWIVATLGDVTTDKELVVEGEFHDKNDASKDIYRKLAPYAQDADHNVTERYTVTAPKMTVKSPNFRIQGGTFKGDVYVEANGFNLSDATIEGNVYFASQEYKDSSSLEKGKVTGAAEVK